MYLLAVSAATLTSTVLTGCAALEKAAAEGGNRFNYLAAESQIEQMRNRNFDELYNTYKKERDDYKKANPNAVIAEDTILPYMAYLASAAGCAGFYECTPLFDEERVRYAAKKAVFPEYNTKYQHDKALAHVKAIIDEVDPYIAKTNEELKKLQLRLDVIVEAKANQKHMLRQWDWENSEKSVKEKITKIKTDKAFLEKVKKDMQEKSTTIEKRLAELEKKRKDPAFQYPKKNICSSSIPLWKNIKSGMNIIMLETKTDPIDGRTPNIHSRGEKIIGRVIGGIYTLYEDIGMIKFLYARENMKDAKTGVFVGIQIDFNDKKLFDDLVKKYKNEMPKARVKKDTFESKKQECSNYFTRYEFIHEVEFREGARVVLVIKKEIKTITTNAFKKLPPKRKEQILKAFQKEWNVSGFNNPNAVCRVIIYDEEQLKAYHQFYLKYEANQKDKKEKENQEKLDF